MVLSSHFYNTMFDGVLQHCLCFAFTVFVESLHDVSVNGIVQYARGFLPYILLFTQAPILLWFDGTIIDISTILLTMNYSGYVGL